MITDEEKAAIRAGDGIPVLLNEAHGFRSTGSHDLEVMVVGIAAQKNVLDTVEVR